MKKVNILAILIAIVLIVTAVVLVGWHMVKSEPVLIQGTVECTSYKASSKIPGRIDALKVRQGDKVEKGQLLYVLSTPEAQAGKELAAKTYERVQNLYRDGVVPAQKLDEAKANYDAMVATESAAHSQYELAVDGASKEDKAAAAAQVRQAQGAVNEVEAYISDAMVYSPVTGEVSTVISEAGELVGSGYPVITILDLSDMWVTFNVKETMLPNITVGKKVKAYVPALDKDVELVVTYIAVQADFATWNATRTRGGFDIRTFAVKMKPTIGIENLRPGMSVIVNWSEMEDQA